MKLTLGEHWGSITVKELFDEEVSVKSNGITETITVPQVVVQCDCGELKTIPRLRFPNKRTLRDCGCGIANSTREMKTVMTVYVSVNTVLRVQNYAANNQLTKSRATEELLSIGLAANES